MQRVDYDQIAETYDQRYATNDFAETEHVLRDFLAPACSIAELGCGTGHWLEIAERLPHRPFVVGLDRAWAMLERARKAASPVPLVRGDAERLPWASGAFDRVFCINALHHFSNHRGVLRECAHVLRTAGAFMTIGLDPHAGHDAWWIYEYFPGALAADRSRYPSANTIRAQLTGAGFSRVETVIAQHLPAAVSFDEAEAKGFLDRHSTSQLLVIDDGEWKAGLKRLRAERPALHADLRLYATVGWRN